MEGSDSNLLATTQAHEVSRECKPGRDDAWHESRSGDGPPLPARCFPAPMPTVPVFSSSLFSLLPESPGHGSTLLHPTLFCPRWQYRSTHPTTAGLSSVPLMSYITTCIPYPFFRHHAA